MGIRQYARHRERLGLPGGTPAAVRAAIKTGRLSAALTPGRKHVKSAAAADAEWEATTKADYVPVTGPTSTAPSNANGNGNGKANGHAAPMSEHLAARTRSEAAKAELAEIGLAQRRGELLLAREVEAKMADVFLRCRTRLLGIPTRLREQDPTLTAPQIELAEKLIRETLEELADGGAAGKAAA